MSEEKVYWEYFPGEFSKEFSFEDVHKEIGSLAKEYKVYTQYGTFKAKRISCLFHDSGTDIKSRSQFFLPEEMPHYDWSVAPITEKLKSFVEKMEGRKVKYCYAHIYRDGKDTLGWHNDKESLHEVVYSISFGCARPFRFRPKGAKSGKCAEFNLGNGDMLIMKKGCQTRFEHTVPPTAKAKTERVNYTFRF